MILSKPLSAIGKGQVRCFQCRLACLMKDGGWHDHKSQQVFLCRSCEKGRDEPRQSRSTFVKDVPPGA